MQQQQQYADFDLLAVFSEESKADAAESKLRKEGFGEEEVFRMVPGSVGKGEFREHGPNRDRSSVFLQTTRLRPRPGLVIFFAVLFGVVLGALSFGVFDFGIKSVSVLPATLLGALVGVIVGVIVGLTRRGRVRGAIGQDLSKVKPVETPRPVNRPDPGAGAGALTVVAVRLPDPDNISRKSKARAILLNNGGKLDRSVGR
jgi:hypothetical protein